MKTSFNFKNDGFQLIHYSNTKNFCRLCDDAYAKFNISDKKNFNKKWSGKDGNYKLIQNPHKKINSFKKILNSKEVKKVIKSQFGEVPVAINHSKISFKNFNSDQRWYPHQDIVYFKDKSQKGITICIYLEDNPKNSGNIICYRKSHKSTKNHKITFLKNETEPQIYCQTKGYKAVSIDAKKGDILFMDTKTIHSSKNNIFKNKKRPIFIFSIVEICKKKIELDDEGDCCFIYNNYKYPKNIFFSKLIFKMNLYKISILKKILYLSYKFGLFHRLKLKN
jgi:ectoine hydroxylase-related dioxygenase (phytanoyl-CoA dioxygenase family)